MILRTDEAAIDNESPRLPSVACSLRLGCPGQFRHEFVDIVFSVVHNSTRQVRPDGNGRQLIGAQASARGSDAARKPDRGMAEPWDDDPGLKGSKRECSDASTS